MPYVMALYGTGDNTKTDEFSEKIQTAFDPPPLILGKLFLKPRLKVQNLQY